MSQIKKKNKAIILLWTWKKELVNHIRIKKQGKTSTSVEGIWKLLLIQSNVILKYQNGNIRVLNEENYRIKLIILYHIVTDSVVKNGYHFRFKLICRRQYYTE